MATFECVVSYTIPQSQYSSFIDMLLATLGEDSDIGNYSAVGWIYRYDEQCPKFQFGEEKSVFVLHRVGTSDLNTEELNKIVTDVDETSDYTLKYIGNRIKNTLNVEVRKDVILDISYNAPAFLEQLGCRRSERYEQYGRRFCSRDGTEIRIYSSKYADQDAVSNENVKKEDENMVVKLLTWTSEAHIQESCQRLRDFAAVLQL